jgi:hypothetical protein
MTATADTYEDRLLDALLDRFDTLAFQPPTEIAAPRRPSTRRYGIPLAGLAAAATAASLTFIEMGGTTPVKHVESSAPAYALATWTARPTSADPAQISAAEAHCSPGGTQPAPGDKQGPVPSGGPWSPVLVDTRGDLTMALYSNGAETMACLASPSVIQLSPIDTTGEPPVTDNTASLDKVTFGKVAGDVYTVAVGRTGSSVTSVGLHLVDGSEVTATVGNGHFIAWWPEGTGVKGLSVTTNTGTQNYPVDRRFALPGSQPTNKAVRVLGDHPSNKSS